MKPYDFLLVRLRHLPGWKETIKTVWGESVTVKVNEYEIAEVRWDDIADMKLSPVHILDHYNVLSKYNNDRSMSGTVSQA